MGAAWSALHRKGVLPDTEPPYLSKPTFDPQLGFDTPRKARDPKISLEEMEALKIPKDKRDYCAYLAKEYMICKKYNAPFMLNCKNEFHNYRECQYDDFFHRMKEFEREKRLRLRQKKMEEMGVAA